MGGGVPDVSLFLFRADRDVYIVGIIMGNAVAPRGGLGGGVCRRLMVGVMVADISMCATVGLPRRRGLPALEEFCQSPQSLREVGLVDDRVPSIDRFGLVPRDLHGDRSGDTSTLQVPDCGAAKIME